MPTSIVIDLPSHIIVSQLENEIKSQLPLSSISTTDGIFTFYFDEDISELTFNSIVAAHVPDRSIYYQNFSKLGLNHKYDEFDDKISVNSLTFVKVYEFLYDAEVDGLYKLNLNYKYSYSHLIRQISIMTICNNNVIEIFESGGTYNNLLVPNQLVKFLNLVEGNNNLQLLVSCSNIEDTACVSNIVLEMYRA
jgi:hypothetical protein